MSHKVTARANPRTSVTISQGGRYWLLGSLVYGLFLLALLTLKGELLALAIPPAVYLGAALLFKPARLQLQVLRTLSALRAHPAASVQVCLRVTNRGPLLEEVLVQDAVPPALGVTAGTTRGAGSLPPGGVLELEYVVRAERGEFEFSDVRVTAGDHLGLLRRLALLPAPGRLLVMPDVRRMRRVAIRPLQTRVHAGPIPARQGGSGVEFFGLREYHFGDPRRRINWRASARHLPALFTNEFQQERIADVGLILDARQRRDVQVSGGALFEHAVRATASLADAFLRDGNRVGLLIYGWHCAWTFPGYGRVQRERLMQALARATTVASMSLDHVPTRLFPARSQLVLISSLHRDDLPVLIRLRARGYQLLVVSPDPITFEAQVLASQPGVALAARIARVERALLFSKLRQAGIDVIDWQVDRSFDAAVSTALGRQPPRWRLVRM